ncbi:MAG: BMC domain-containing protein [Eubacteriales bacterium]
MYQAVGIVELKSIAKGVEACDDALKSAGISLVSAHPACPGKYEIIVTGAIADVTASIAHVKSRFGENIIDSSVMGRIDPQVITALFGTEPTEKKGSLGIIETFSAASAIKAADIAVKTAKVSIYDLRVSRGMGGKGIVMITGDVGDVTASVEAGAGYAADGGLLANKSVIAAPHKELWEQI